MTTPIYEQVHNNLKILKLNTIEEMLDSCLERAAKEQQSPMEVLSSLIDEEVKARKNKEREKFLKLSRIPFIKTVDDFDFDFQPSIDKSVINDLNTLRFIHNAENVVFLGPPGVGKTHLSISLGISAINAGLRVHYLTASVLMSRLRRSFKKDTLSRYIARLTSYDLLIIDEIGYRPFDSDAAHCFFQLICSRYEKGSIIFTSNKSFSKWDEIFNDSIIATAFLDRILHHCTTVNIKGDSYRLKEKESTKES